MFAKARVELKTNDGVTLRGDFYQAEGQDRAIVILTAGFPLLKEHYIAAFAERFQKAGFSALAVDYRGWGSSEGFPRFESNLMLQGDDYRDAVTAAAKLPGVNPRKIFLDGIGHAGAAAIIAAADDPRIAGVMSQSPAISGRRDRTIFGEKVVARDPVDAHGPPGAVPWGVARGQGSMQLRVGAHQCVQCEVTIEATGVGENPGQRTTELHRLSAPQNDGLIGHEGKGAFAKKSDAARGIPAHLGFERMPSLPEFIRQNFLGATSGSAHNCRDAAAVVEQPALVFRPKNHVRETGPLQDAPESITAVREIMASGGGTGGRIEAAEDDIQASGQHIWLIGHHIASPTYFA